MKRSLFAYLIYVKDSLSPNVSNNDSTLSHTQVNHEKEPRNLIENASRLNEFLKLYDSCFTNSILDELPHPQGVDDHRIDLL